MLKLNKVTFMDELSLDLEGNSRSVYTNASERQINLLIGYAQFACQDIYEELSKFENVGFEFTEKNAVDVVKSVFYTEECVSGQDCDFTVDLYKNYEHHSYEKTLSIHENNKHLNDLLLEIVLLTIEEEARELAI